MPASLMCVFVFFIYVLVELDSQSESGEHILSNSASLKMKSPTCSPICGVIIIIIMQRLTRHVSVIRLTNRRRGVTWIYG